MLGTELKEEDFKSRKEYLVTLAIQYIRSHTGYLGMDDDIFFDDAECDGFALANDLASEFELDEMRDY